MYLMDGYNVKICLCQLNTTCRNTHHIASHSKTQAFTGAEQVLRVFWFQGRKFAYKFKEVQVLWVVTPCSVVAGNQTFWRIMLPLSSLHPDDGSSMDL
jgi:hypothetical protein